MAELFFFFFLASPLLLIWWLFAAKRKADRLVREREESKPAPIVTHAYEEVTVGADGLNYGTSYAGDAATLTPDNKTASLDGIKALEGRT